MKPKYHVVASGIISAIIYFLTKSVPASIAAFIAGVFTDIDHFLDYYLNYGFSLNVVEIYKAVDNKRLQRLYLFLHSYEVVAIFWLTVFLVPLNSIYFAIAIGMTQHVFFDQAYNPVKPRTYFLTYRIMKGFNKDNFMREKRIKASV